MKNNSSNLEDSSCDEFSDLEDPFFYVLDDLIPHSGTAPGSGSQDDCINSFCRPEFFNPSLQHERAHYNFQTGLVLALNALHSMPGARLGAPSMPGGISPDHESQGRK